MSARAALLRAAAFVAALSAGGAAAAESTPAPGGEPSAEPSDLTAALLAIEEAELRERMITALAVAEGVRLRGRTVLVAMSEIARVREALATMQPGNPRRAAIAARLDALEVRQREVTAIVDQEFQSYVEIVSDIAVNLWPRLRRIGSDLEKDLAARSLDRLNGLLPLLRTHIEEMNRKGGVEPETLAEWRAEVDDTYARRQQGFPASAPPATAPPPTDRDI